jgi:hypothetical protein
MAAVQETDNLRDLLGTRGVTPAPCVTRGMRRNKYCVPGIPGIPPDELVAPFSGGWVRNSGSGQLSGTYIIGIFNTLSSCVSISLITTATTSLTNC